MNSTLVATTTNNDEPRTMNFQKQTQSKPNLPAIQAGKFALSLPKGLLKTLTSSAGKFASSPCPELCRMGQVERPIQTAIRQRWIQNKGMMPRASFQLHTPIGVVEELLPAFVAGLAEVNVHKRIVLRPGRDTDKREAGLLGSSATFFNVTFGAGADHIFPVRFSAHTARDNVVEGKLAGVVTFAAILAAVSVACEDVAAIEFYLAPWEAVIEQKTDNPRDGDVEIYGGNPVAAIRLEIAFEFADLAPGLEIVVGVCALLEGDYLGKLAKEQRKRASCADNADGHIVLVQDKNITIQARFIFRGNHKSPLKTDYK
jgi:hypothetical protein